MFPKHPPHLSDTPIIVQPLHFTLLLYACETSLLFSADNRMHVQFMLVYIFKLALSLGLKTHEQWKEGGEREGDEVLDSHFTIYNLSAVPSIMLKL